MTVSPGDPTVPATVTLPIAGDRPSGGPTLPGGATGRGATGGLAADLPSKAADAVDLLVDTVFDRVVRPLMVAARALVFGLVGLVLLLVVLVLVSAGLVRLLDVYAFGGRVWISYAVIGGLFSLAGGFAWSRRHPRSPVAG